MEPSGQPFSAELRRMDEAVVVTLRGGVEMDEVDQLDTLLAQARDPGKPLFVLDMRELAFLCSAALGSLIETHHHLRDAGSQIRLVDPQPAIRGVLQTTRLDRVFPIYDDLDAAVSR